MGRTVMGVVGAVAGGVYGYYTGDYSAVAYGWSIGYGVGAATESKPGMEGPRLSDLRFTSSQYGQAIPWIRGAPRVSGQIVWASTKREVSTTTEAGKGGGQESTTFTYVMDVLVLLCDHEALAVTRIWSNGKLVWTGRADASSGSISASSVTDVWSRLNFYSGAVTQLPDPTYEAAVGAGNAPAYRGRATLMIEGLALGGSGQLPNLTFEVARGGTTGNQGFAGPNVNAGGTAYSYSPGGAGFNAGWYRTAGDRVGLHHFELAISGPARGWIIGMMQRSNYAGSAYSANPTGNPAWAIDNINYFGLSIGRIENGSNFFDASMDFDSTSAIVGVSFDYTTLVLTIAVNGVTKWTRTLPSADFDPYWTCYAASGTYVADIKRFDSEWTYPPTDAASWPVYAVTPATETIQSVVEALCARAGMPAGTYDASALSSITKPVRALAVTGGGARGTLDQLGSAFFFQACLRDKLYFRPRGAATVATIPWADLAANAEEPAEQSLPLSVGNDLELPPQVAVTYINVNNDAQSGTEYSDRMTGGQAAVQAVQLALGMTPAEAKGVADAVVVDTAAALVSGAISLPMSYARLDPSDVVDIVDRDGRSYRMRLVRKRDERGVLSFEVVGDDATAITSQQTTDGTQTPASTVTRPGDTLFIPLDVPLLRDADDEPGYYLAAKGSTASWPGGSVLSSSDNTTFATVATHTTVAVFGTCATALGAFSGVGFDEAASVTVSVGNGTLSSTTRTAMLADESINAMMVGSELIRFRTATLSSPGVYVLTGLLRGQKGTEWAIGSHAASEPCALLTTSGLRRVTQQASENGLLRYLRGGTLGGTVGTTSTTFTNANRGLKPLAPVDVRTAAQPSQDLLITWRRRSRLSAAFLAPTGVRLGESTEAYVIRIYTLSPVTLRRTLFASTPQVSYTRAQQLADGIAGGTALRVDVTQTSAAVGEGYVGTTSAAAGSAITMPQIYTITLGGTFSSGTLLRAVLGSLTVNYTTVSGDATVAGAATSFAAAIDATAPYAATAVGNVITVTGAPGVAYQAAASIPAGDNTALVTSIQPAADPVPATAFLAYVAISNVTTGLADTIPAGITLSVQVIYPYGTTACSVSYTTPSALPAAYVHAAIRDLTLADPNWTGPGYSYGQNYLSGSPVGVVVGPAGAANVQVQLSATPPFAMTASVQSVGTTAIPAALPQINGVIFFGTVTPGFTYRITLAGTNFDYVAVSGDTLVEVTAALAALVDASPNYLAISTLAGTSGYAVRVTGAASGSAAAFSYTGAVISSAMTATGSITQFAN